MKRKVQEASEPSDAEISPDLSEEDGMSVESVESVHEEETVEAPTEKKQKLNDGGVSRKQEQKEKKQTRQIGKAGGDTVVRAKRVWEDLRSREMDRKQKVALVADTLTWVKPNIQDVRTLSLWRMDGEAAKTNALELIFKHDASRIIQSMIKYGAKEHRKIIVDELKTKFVDLMQSNQDARPIALKEIKGKVAKLMRHTEASNVVEELYANHSNAKQRNEMMEEFYGPEFSVFKVRDPSSSSDLGKFLEQNPLKKESVIKSLAEHVNSILSKPSTLTSLSMLHRVLHEFLREADTETVTPHLALFSDHVVHILHTKDGSAVARYVLLHGDAKVRKQILKTFKTFVSKIALDPIGYPVLLTVMDSVDDTVTVGKTIVAELAKDAVDISKDKHGSRVMLYLLTGRSQRYHTKELLNDLSKTDELRKKTSKKDDKVRQKELLASAVKPLVEAFKGHAVELVKNRWAHQVLVETIKAAGKDAEPLLLELAEACAGKPGDVVEKDPEAFHPVKKLAAEAAKAAEAAQDDEDSKQHVLVNRSSSFAIKELLVWDRSSQVGFATLVLHAVEKTADFWVRDYCCQDPLHTNGAAFVLVSLLEHNDESVSKRAQQLFVDLDVAGLSSKVSELQGDKKTGVSILLSKLPSAAAPKTTTGKTDKKSKKTEKKK